MGGFFLTSPGAPSGVGPIGDMEGRILGLVPDLHLIGDVGGPAAAALIGARQKVRDFNDAEAFPLEGSDQGKTVPGGPTPPRGGWTPPSTGPVTPSGGDQDLEDAYWTAHAKRAGRENRAAYRRWMGTPRRRPMQEEPFGPEDYGTAPEPPKRKPGDTSDLRRNTP